MREKYLSALIVMLLLVFAVSGVVLSQEEYVMKLSFADPNKPFEQATAAQLNVFKSQVEALTAGQIKVELYPAGQIGDQRSSTEQVKNGTIQAAAISTGVMSSAYYEPLQVVDLPFVFSSREVARRVLDPQNPFTKKLIEDCADKTNIRLLTLEPFGFRSLTNNKRPIKSPEDLKGLKIRTMEVVPHMKLIEALGAKPVPVPFTELYTSLETGVVDGQENPPQNIKVQHFYEVQDYMTLSKHVLGVSSILVNEDWYQSLPDNLKVKLQEGLRVSMDTYNGMGALIDSQAMIDLEKDMEVYYPTEEEMAAFREAAQPVYDWMREEVGEELVNDFLAEVEKAEEELQQETETTIRK